MDRDYRPVPEGRAPRLAAGLRWLSANWSWPGFAAGLTLAFLARNMAWWEVAMGWAALWLLRDLWKEVGRNERRD